MLFSLSSLCSLHHHSQREDYCQSLIRDSIDFIVFVQNLSRVFLLSELRLWYQIDENVQREIINHRSLRHPNIIRFKEVRSYFSSANYPFVRLKGNWAFWVKQMVICSIFGACNPHVTRCLKKFLVMIYDCVIFSSLCKVVYIIFSAYRYENICRNH